MDRLHAHNDQQYTQEIHLVGLGRSGLGVVLYTRAREAKGGILWPGVLMAKPVSFNRWKNIESLPQTSSTKGGEKEIPRSPSCKVSGILTTADHWPCNAGQRRL